MNGSLGQVSTYPPAVAQQQSQPKPGAVSGSVSGRGSDDYQSQHSSARLLSRAEVDDVLFAGPLYPLRCRVMTIARDNIGRRP